MTSFATKLIAPIDRHVRIISGPEYADQIVSRVSDLRRVKHVVVLGEPGIGKSTVMQLEAALAGTSLYKARALITEDVTPTEPVLFIDALDEYRADGAKLDKMDLLAKKIREIGPEAWRLACRSEDWRKDADIAAIRSITDEALVVVQLQPLLLSEVTQILEFLQEADPDEFISKAERMGATAFLESPLSLMLLHKATVVRGDWPATRHELFSSATRQLAYEANIIHKHADRHAQEAILRAAGTMCLLLLATGARAIWMSNGAPPSSGDDREFIEAQQCWIDLNLLRDTLDTALFRGEGESFEPFHRSIAEFLAGKALADLVNASETRAALPFSRAVALITGSDHMPASETRGLYGWFTTHLAAGKQLDYADALIDADSLTVLLYGDAAVFEKSSRLRMLHALAGDNRGIGGWLGGITVGSLASLDMETELRQIIEDPDEDQEDRILTAYLVLQDGRDIPSLLPTYLKIAHASNRPRWQRDKAIGLLVRGATDPAATARKLFDTLAHESPSSDRAHIRLGLITKLPVSNISADDVRAVLGDYESYADERTIGELIELEEFLVAHPSSEIFEVPALNWRPQDGSPFKEKDVDTLLDKVLAEVIAKTSNYSASDFWRWVRNSRKYFHSAFGGETVLSLRHRAQETFENTRALHNAIILDDPSTDITEARVNFQMVTGGGPNASLVEAVIATVSMSGKTANSLRLLDAVSPDIKAFKFGASLFWYVYDLLEERRELERLENFAYSTVDEHTLGRKLRENQRAQEKESQREAEVAKLMPMLDDLRVGKPTLGLNRASEHYLRNTGRDGREPGLTRIIEGTNSTIALAIVEGFKHVAASATSLPSATQLGQLDLMSQRHVAELPALSGLDWMLENDELPRNELPMMLAVCVLRWSTFIQNAERKRTVERWASDRLLLNPEEGAHIIGGYWEAIIDGGGSLIRGLSLLDRMLPEHSVARIVFQTTLTQRPNMEPLLLKQMLSTAASHLPHEVLTPMAKQALVTQLSPDQRLLWSTLELSLDPVSCAEQYLASYGAEDLLDLFENFPKDGLVFQHAQNDDRAKVYLGCVAICSICPKHTPTNIPLAGRVTTEQRVNRTIQKILATIASVPIEEATHALRCFLQDSALRLWYPAIEDALRQHQSIIRDFKFQHPSLAQVTEALTNGPPINAGDLRAILNEELGHLQRELRVSDGSPWKRYWNLDSNGEPTQPQVENACRDQLLERLKDRLRRYKTGVVVPEAQRQMATRSDILFLGGADFNVPIEIKRHWHKELWRAASTQLQRYAADVGAAGCGVYLVFWFGQDAEELPPRTDKQQLPTNARELEAMLKADLSDEIRELTSVFVFDVSPPAKKAPNKRSRKSKPTR